MSPRRRSRLSLILSLFLLASFTAAALSAQPGELDRGFGRSGRTTIGFSSKATLQGANDVAVQKDGRIVVAGMTSDSKHPGNHAIGALARLRPNGALDRSFSDDGKVTLASKGMPFDAVAIDHDGRIVVVGSATHTGQIFVARYLSGGELDRSFGDQGVALIEPPGPETSALPADISVNSDQQIVVVGSVFRSAHTTLLISKLGDDGAPVEDFADSGSRSLSFGARPTATSLVTTNGPRITIAGRNDRGDAIFARVRPDGELDPTFGDRGRLRIDTPGQVFDQNSLIYGLGRYPFLAAMTTTSPNGQRSDIYLYSFGTHGEPSRTFGRHGAMLLDLDRKDKVESVAVGHNFKPVIASTATPKKAGGRANFLVIRLKKDGRLDPKFSGNGRAFVDFPGSSVRARAVALTPGNKRVVVAGNATRRSNKDRRFAVAELIAR